MCNNDIMPHALLVGAQSTPLPKLESQDCAHDDMVAHNLMHACSDSAFSRHAWVRQRAR